MNDIAPLIREKAPLILAHIKKAKSVLLHCHPSPDPDSVGSALAMKLAVEQLGTKATVIKGDSDIPEAFMHFPGAKDILMKSYHEIDPTQYDLFIILDSGRSRVSMTSPAIIPPGMTTINIDHHNTNAGTENINIIDPTFPATCQMLYELFIAMGITITSDIATNLFMGMFTDTLGFRTESTTYKTLAAASELVKIAPGISKTISIMDQSNSPEFLAFKGLALSNIKTFFGCVALSCVSNAELQSRKISEEDVAPSVISGDLRHVKGWEITGCLVEALPEKIRISFRSQDAKKYDVSLLAAALGGGGHKAAAGARLNMPLEEAKSLVVAKIKELYNL